jgi:hypothetical protein
MRRTRLEEAWACWLPGSAGGPRLNICRLPVRSVWSLTVVTTWTSVAVPWPTLTAWQLAGLKVRSRE